MTIKKLLTAALAFVLMAGTMAGASTSTGSTSGSPASTEKLPPDWSI
jgi:curli biogenesis system outer membrane secretion channel CsgG